MNGLATSAPEGGCKPISIRSALVIVFHSHAAFIIIGPAPKDV
jgi:hypothetical protein